jgi:predicted TIM-barrel enzyme
MIHMTGRDGKDKVDRAIKEMQIYQEEGVSGVIVENYYGDIFHIAMAMSAMHEEGFDSIVAGVNCLENTKSAVFISDMCKGKFIQVDSVQGNAYDSTLDTLDQFVLGGVGFKYQPEGRNSLEYDLGEGMERCDAIVTTGEGIGIETPLPKLIGYKNILGDFPLIVGAGMNSYNAHEQLKIADGAIVGSWFKPNGDTSAMVDRNLVQDLMAVVRKVRE